MCFLIKNIYENINLMNFYIYNNLKNKSYYIADQALNPKKILQWKEISRACIDHKVEVLSKKESISNISF